LAACGVCEARRRRLRRRMRRTINSSPAISNMVRTPTPPCDIHGEALAGATPGPILMMMMMMMIMMMMIMMRKRQGNVGFLPGRDDAVFDDDRNDCSVGASASNGIDFLYRDRVPHDGQYLAHLQLKNN